MGIWKQYVGMERAWAHLTTPKKFTGLHKFYDSPSYETSLKVWVGVSVVTGIYVGYKLYQLQQQPTLVYVPAEWSEEDEEAIF